MSYYFAIIGTQDNPLFEYDFGTSKQGGDGMARFTEQARQLNQFIIHSSLDIVEEVQWTNGQMYVFLRSAPTLLIPFFSLPALALSSSIPANMLTPLSSPQVPKTSRPLLHLLHLVLPNRLQHQIPSPPPTPLLFFVRSPRLLVRSLNPHL